MNEGKKDRREPIRTVKPRNFVAKNAGATTSGAGAHKDKKKAEKNGDVKHKKAEYAESLQHMLESALRDKEDYTEKRKALDALSRNKDVDQKASFDYTTKDLGNDYAGFASNHSMKHKFLARIKPEKQQLYKDKINNTHEWDDLFALFNVAKQRGDIIEQGVAEGSTDLVQIEYWQQETMESGRWVKTKPIPRATAEKIVNSFERGEIVNVEQGVAEGEYDGSGLYSPRAIKIGSHFIKEFNLTDEEDQQLAIEIVDNCLEGGLSDLTQIRKQVIKYLKQSGAVIQIRKKDVAEEFDSPEYNDEAGMARGNLLTLARAVKGLMDTIDDNDNLPEWCQEKIAKSEMMLVTVWDYLLSQKEQGIDPSVKEAGYRDYDDNRQGFKRREREDDEYHVPDPEVKEASINEIKKGQKDGNGFTKCWPGKHAEGTKKGKNGKPVRNCKPNEGWTHDSLAAQIFETENTYEDRLTNLLNKQLGK